MFVHFYKRGICSILSISQEIWRLKKVANHLADHTFIGEENYSNYLEKSFVPDVIYSLIPLSVLQIQTGRIIPS